MAAPPRPAPAARAVTSRRHPLVDRFRRAARGEAGDPILLDGEHLLEVALDTRWPVEVVAATWAMAPGGSVPPLARRVREAGLEVTTVSRAVLEALSPVRHPGAVVALARRPATALDGPFAAPCPLVVVACDVQDPGNLGAIVRAADACGASGVVCAGECADPCGWKALRGSMGSVLRLPVAVERRPEVVLDALLARGVQVIAATGREGVPPAALDWARPTALLLGNEGGGLPATFVAAAGARVAIPMRAGVDSLNVAVAAGILLYEAARRRGSP